MITILRSKNFYLMLLMDAVLVALAYVIAHWLRFEGNISRSDLGAIINALYYLVPFKLICFYVLGLYQGMWRYTSISDLRNVFEAVCLSSAFIFFLILFRFEFQGYSRAVYFIDWVLTFMFIGGIRVVIRMVLGGAFVPYFTNTLRSLDFPVKKMLIAGAGDAGEKVLREIIETQQHKILPVGFVDDDPAKKGKMIHDVQILESLDNINKIKIEFDEILIAMPSVQGAAMRRIVSLCEKTGKPFRTVPGIWELIEGKIRVQSIRKVHLEDLIERQEVRLDTKEIRNYIKDKKILITGAGGSIGSELVNQVGSFHPQAMALLDFSEEKLFNIERVCRERFGFIPVSEFLVDLKNRNSLRRVFDRFKPDVIFHAAAYKHVPMQEVHPWEAVANNIEGTRNLIKVALEGKVDRFVLVSTDKAVRPANVMGATKRVAEMMVESCNGKCATRFMAVRFGNVLWSSGSAIPTFQKQISMGMPVTVTHPEITRYFMSIPEAVQLILQAGAMGNGCEIFILNMGKPIRIIDLARDLIRLSGFEPEKDIPIQFIGLRPGEKLYEELITEGEGIVPTNHENILVLKGNGYQFDTLNAQIDELIAVAHTYDTAAIKEKLVEIVPEYTPYKDSSH